METEQARIVSLASNLCLSASSGDRVTVEARGVGAQIWSFDVQGSATGLRCGRGGAYLTAEGRAVSLRPLLVPPERSQAWKLEASRSGGGLQIRSLLDEGLVLGVSRAQPIVPQQVVLSRAGAPDADQSWRLDPRLPR